MELGGEKEGGTLSLPGVKGATSDRLYPVSVISLSNSIPILRRVIPPVVFSLFSLRGGRPSQEATDRIHAAVDRDSAASHDPLTA